MHAFRRPAILLLLVLAIVLLIGGLALLYSESQQKYVVDLDGRQIQLAGHFSTVAQALDSAQITVRDEDFVQPPLQSPLPASAPIVIRSAMPVELILDGQSDTVWTHQKGLASFLAERGLILDRSSKVMSDGELMPLAGLADAPLGQTVAISTTREVTILDGASTQVSVTLVTAAGDVGQALFEAGIDVYGADYVDPAMREPLPADGLLTIERATPVTVAIDGNSISARTTQTEVAGVLADLGVGLIGRDVVSPDLGRQLTSAEPITIERHNTTYERVDSPLAYSSSYQPNPDLEIDQRSLMATGASGTSTRLSRIDNPSTATISQTVVGEWVSQQPTDEVVGYGTNIVVRTLDTLDGPISYWRVVRMRVTAYTAADAGKPRSHPSYGITASGRPAGYGIVSIDPNVVPFRSQVYVPGYGVAFAGDTGGGVKGRWIDLGYNEGEIQAWRGYVDVYYLTPVPEADRINFLIPSSLP